MNRTIQYTIEEEYAGERILDYLRLKGFSRNILSSMKNYGSCIYCNQDAASGNRILSASDVLLVHVPETESSLGIAPVCLPLSILYEDEDLMILDKPSGMPIHPSIGNYENTLANAVMWYQQKEQGRSGFVYRCINRLDRDTSGAILLAKNPLSGAILSRQMRNREIHRTYLAIVEGSTEPYGTVNAPISRKKGSAIEREINYAEGASAITHYKTLKYYENHSLIELQLETGRTHQIRVHMKHIGHPLPCDFLYHPSYSLPMNRQPLHSYQLRFYHPITKEPMLFTAPVPDEFSL
ncbi:MAG: RluA family pseudouridine synthase [Blautia sp.]|nr:RluA family pseudouridine synthase [Blautia sp.]